MNEVLNEGRGFETVFQEPGCGEMQERRPLCSMHAITENTMPKRIEI
jgi:hypothetical protein